MKVPVRPEAHRDAETSSLHARVQVLDVLSGQQSPAEACRKHALSPKLLSIWKAHFLDRASSLFQPDGQREGDQAHIAEHERMLGQATLQIEVLPLNASIARPSFSPDPSLKAVLISVRT
jgi:putative transposase